MPALKSLSKTQLTQAPHPSAFCARTVEWACFKSKTMGTASRSRTSQSCANASPRVRLRGSMICARSQASGSVVKLSPLLATCRDLLWSVRQRLTSLATRLSFSMASCKTNHRRVLLRRAQPCKSVTSSTIQNSGANLWVATKNTKKLWTL